jgi:alanine dehydrogenase
MLYFSLDECRGALSVHAAAGIIDETYRAIGEGKVEASQPSMMRIGTTPLRLGAKGAVLNHLDIAGVRLTSRAAPRLMLWSLESGEPIAFFDESEMYRFRTGVSAAVVARYLLQGRPLQRAAIIGAGPIAQQMASAIHQLLLPSRIAVTARNRTSAERFAADAMARGEPVVVADTVIEATRDAQLIITITSANEVLVMPEHVSADAILLSMGGGLEISHDVWNSASCRFVDDLSYALHQGDAANWIKAGTIDRAAFEASLTGTVADLAAGRVTIPAREGPVMAIVQGTTALDIALAHSIYRSRRRVQENL